MGLGHCKIHIRDPLGPVLGALVGRPSLCLNAVTGPGIIQYTPSITHPIARHSQAHAQ